MKLYFKQNNNNHFSTSIEGIIEHHIRKRLEDLGNIEFFLDKMPAIMHGVNRSLLEISKAQNDDQIHLHKKVIELKEGNYEIINTLEEFLAQALNEKANPNSIERLCDYTMEAITKVANEQNLPFEPLDPNKELEAIIEFVEERWNGFNKVDIRDFFSQIWQKSLELTKNKINEYDFIDIYEEWKKERENYFTWDRAGTLLTKEQVKRYKYDDYIYNFIDGILSAPNKFNAIIMKDWDYGKNVNNILKEVKEKFPSATKLRPKGWKELAKDYSDYAGQDEYCQNQQAIDDKAFKGINSGSAASFPFQGRVALPYVMYDNKCQGRKPLQVLIGAVLSHAYAFQMRNNNAAITKELYDLKDELSASKYYQNIVLDLDLSDKFKSPIMKAFYVVISDRMIITSESEFKQMVEADKLDNKNTKLQTVVEPLMNKSVSIAGDDLFDMQALMDEIADIAGGCDIESEKKKDQSLTEKVWSILSEENVTKKLKPKVK